MKWPLGGLCAASFGAAVEVGGQEEVRVDDEREGQEVHFWHDAEDGVATYAGKEGQMTHFPANLTIGGKQWRVTQKKMADSENVIHYGETIHPELKININSTPKIEHRKETLLHEILHIISEERGIGLRERQIKCLSNGLYDTMKRNRYKVW